MTQAPLGRRSLAEFVGTAFLLAAIVGSGAMAERLTDDVGLQLLQNATATAGALVALILAFAPASGAVPSSPSRDARCGRGGSARRSSPESYSRSCGSVTPLRHIG
jgi:hypothetical protein